jgi:HEAT repeat protein
MGLFEDVRPAVRRTAVAALAECGGGSALDFLKRAYLAGRLSPMLDALVDGLSRARGADPVPLLLQIAEQGDSETRRLVIEALGKRDSRGAGPFLLAEMARERSAGRPLTPLVRALVLLNDPSIGPRLLEIFSELEEFEGLALLCQYFEKNGVTAAIAPALTRLSQERDLDRLALLIDLLGALGAVDAVPALEPLLEHRAAGIRLIAANVLERLTGRSYPVRGMP